MTDTLARREVHALAKAYGEPNWLQRVPDAAQAAERLHDDGWVIFPSEALEAMVAEAEGLTRVLETVEAFLSSSDWRDQPEEARRDVLGLVNRAITLME